MTKNCLKTSAPDLKVMRAASVLSALKRECTRRSWSFLPVKGALAPLVHPTVETPVSQPQCLRTGSRVISSRSGAGLSPRAGCLGVRPHRRSSGMESDRQAERGVGIDPRLRPLTGGLLKVISAIVRVSMPDGNPTTSEAERGPRLGRIPED